MTETVAPPRVRAGGIGDSPPRKEDDRLLQGAGRFADDSLPSDALHMAVLRSPFPRARIESIDVADARELPGVLDVLVGTDVAARTRPIDVLRPVPDALEHPYYALAQATAEYEGQPVASVVATSRHLAEDALELIDVDYDPLPHVPDVFAALADDAPVLHPDHMPSNLVAANPNAAGDSATAMAAADVVVEGRFHVGRVTGLPMETRGIVAEWRRGAGELTVRLSTQVPHLVRSQLAHCLRIDEGGVRVVASDVGGAFGLKLGVYPEYLLASLHAMTLRRPIVWIEDRLEHLRGTSHARESVHDFRIGARRDGTIVAIEDIYHTDIGAYNGPLGSAQLSSVVFTGPYKVPDASVERRVTLTSKTPVGAYRGYGQPEVNFAREVLIDRLARRLGVDRVELRARNMLRPEDLPWTNASGAVYDSGDYELALRMAAQAIGYDEIVAAGRGPGRDGRLTGVGLTSFVERTGYAGRRFLQGRGSKFGAHESVTLRANRSGGVDLYTGVSTFGQGAETSFAQVCSEVTRIAYERVRVHAGDTAGTPQNTGSFASRTMIAVSGAIRAAALELRAKTERLGAWMLGVDDVEVAGDVVRSRENPAHAVPLAHVHELAIVGLSLPEGEAPGLEATAHFEPPAAAFAFGSAAAIVRVDPETGEYTVDRFVMVHDCGVVVNPKLVDGQVRGGLAQGFGATLAEELVYDEAGQLVNGTLMDYFVPTACDLPPIELRHTEVPSPVTPFGVRGVGEIGTIPPGAAVANAICDALADFGVELDRLPVTPERVWRAIQSGGRK
jgi:carbon-monoxide dehydrogenase large subunit